MKNKLAFIVGLAVVFIVLSGAALAVQTFSDAIAVPSLRVGEEGIGGVTYFNGTIVNSTTNAGADNPVTFGDDVRIDGMIYRTEVGGVNDIKIADSLRPNETGVYDLGSADFKFDDIYLSGTVDGVNVSDISNDYVNKIDPEWQSRRGYYSLGAAAFRPSQSEDKFGTGNSLAYSVVGNSRYYAAITLPHGSVIDKVIPIIVDNTDSYDAEFNIYRIDSNDNIDIIGTVTTSENSSEIREYEISSLNNNIVDNSEYIYMMNVDIGGFDSPWEMFFHGVRLEYLYTEPY